MTHIIPKTLKPEDFSTSLTVTGGQISFVRNSKT
jgi:hypothetical protein